jgi:hypothetical protein
VCARNPHPMTEHVASRTLVKSPPELWAECSDAASLARHLDRFGEIRITRLDPETAVAWEGERARGTVRIEPAGWGTKVILTAVEVAANVAPEVIEEPELEAVEPEPGVVVEPEPQAVVEPEAEVVEPEAEVVEPDQPAPDPPRRRRFARILGFLRGPEPGAIEPEARPPDDSATAPEEPPPPAESAPPPAEASTPAPPPRRSRVPPSAATEASATAPEPPVAAPEPPVTEAALTAALDSLGQAHHRPYSRA